MCASSKPYLHVGLAGVVQVAAPAVPRAAHAEGLLELVLTLSHTRVVKRQLLPRSHVPDGVQRHSQPATSRHHDSLWGSRAAQIGQEEASGGL